MAAPSSALPLPRVGYEDVAKLAQGYISKFPTVLLGSGATVPFGLPSMADLARGLLSELPKSLAGWERFSESLRKSSDLEAALTGQHLPEETVAAIVASTWRIVCAKDWDFYLRMLSQPVQFPLRDLFAYLLRTAGRRLSVVTTNYDRLAEYAGNAASAHVDTGMSDGWIQRFVSFNASASGGASREYEGRMLVYKVHGSLDWFRDSNGDVVGVPLANDLKHGLTPLMVTPGTGKYREGYKPPFRDVIAAADDALNEARCYLCVGFGFNDDHIQQILLKRVARQGIPIVIVTKQLTPTARQAFLGSPPPKFLLLEEGDGGTLVYSPPHPSGALLEGASVWQLGSFIELLNGGEGDTHVTV